MDHKDCWIEILYKDFRKGPTIFCYKLWGDFYDLKSSIEILNCLSHDQDISGDKRVMIDLIPIQNMNNCQLKKSNLVDIFSILKEPNYLETILSLYNPNESILSIFHVLDYMSPSIREHIRSLLEIYVGKIIVDNKIKYDNTRTKQRKSFLSLLRRLYEYNKYLDSFIILNRMDSLESQRYYERFYTHQHTKIQARELSQIQCKRDVYILLSKYKSILQRNS